MDREAALRRIVESIHEGMSKDEIEALKRRLMRGAGSFPRNSELIRIAREMGRTEIIPLLRKRPMRSLSGITNIAIMSLSDCPHGRCTYCPKGKDAPNSYTGFEPSTMRGIQNKFNAWKQVRARITQLEEIGHEVVKCEVIIQGGTFLAQDEGYQREFIKGMYDALNGSRSGSLEEAIRKNERARYRCVGLTIETRPDWCFESHVDRMLHYGTTRVEIGVQTLSQEVLARVKRGHSLEDVWKATQIARDSLLKVCYHMMPGLYATPEEDVDYFKRLFTDERYQPDMLKIYPLLIMRGTEMYEEWKRGGIRPYSSEEAMEVISEAYRYIPEYVRVMRVQRDIPVYLIEDGVKKSNLRELVEKRAAEKGINIREIRHREVGLRANRGEVDWESLEPVLKRINYRASGGEEVFLQFVDERQDILFAFLRLRLPARPHRKELQGRVAGIRELHVYGEVTPLHRRGKVQHRRLGKALLEEAEKIASEEWDSKKITVISGVGVREYYRKWGYINDGPYMSKVLA